MECIFTVSVLLCKQVLKIVQGWSGNEVIFIRSFSRSKLNQFESKFLISSCNKRYNQIKVYRCYVDYTFMLFSQTNRQTENVMYMNSMNIKIQFTLEMGNNNSLNFLDLTIHKNNYQFKYNIYRKPTTTKITIHANLYHPNSSKMIALNAFVHKMLTIPLNKKTVWKK